MKKQLLPFVALLGALFVSSCKDAGVTKANYDLNEEKSVVEWKGYGPNQFHDGAFSVESEQLEVIDGKLKSGTFTIPIASIRNYDLPDEMKPVLLEHLKSADFFHLAVHPNASFRITQVQPLETAVPGAVEGANHIVTGDFTMLGQTHPVSIPAKITFEGGDLKVLAAFKLDRTKWGMTYAADPALGEHHILPEVDIKLNLVAHKQ